MYRSRQSPHKCRARRVSRRGSASKLPAMKPRWRPAIVGASIGLLAATALIVAEIPGIPGNHATAYLVAGVAVGTLVGQLEWERRIAHVAIGAAIILALLTLTPMLDHTVESW